jgi:adenylate cyclase
MGVLAIAAIREARRRGALARFLPAEIAPLLADPSSPLRPGRNMTAAIAFVDIRGSTALAQRLDPSVLSTLLSEFRREVAQAARAASGVVDKFIGDGALIVFGIAGAGRIPAADALRFSRDLLAQMAKASMNAGSLAGVEIGIGVHFGEVFCGVIGDADRLEFTVLGDTVNVASRLEQATKTFRAPLVASEAVLAAAKEGAERWVEVSSAVLPGRDEAIWIYCEVPRDGRLERRAAPSI